MSVPLEVKDFKVRSLDLDFHEVSWGIENTSEDVLDYTFQLLRSESPSGPFDDLTPPFDDKYIFIDNVIQVANRWRKYYYLLRITNKVNGEFKDFGPVSKEPDADLIALELRRHMLFFFPGVCRASMLGSSGAHVWSALRLLESLHAEANSFGMPHLFRHRVRSRVHVSDRDVGADRSVPQGEPVHERGTAAAGQYNGALRVLPVVEAE